MSKIRIVLADDHALLRAGLAMLLGGQADMEVVGQASSADEALAVVLKCRPDLIVMDLSMPGSDSIKAVERISRESPDTKILVLTTHDDAAYLRATLAAGASGYLVKTATDGELLTALRTVAQGRTAINLSLSKSEMQVMLGAEENNAATNLSPREKEVLVYLARGFTNKQTAEKLFLSVKTIETYRSRIVEKLGLRDRSHLIAYAIDTGLLQSGG